jgi:hypothetical protein
MGNFLRRQRVFRLIGLVVGLVLGSSMRVAGSGMTGAMAGFLLGSAVAALLPSAAKPAGRLALLAPRLPEDYVAPGHLWALRAFALGDVVACFVFWSLQHGDEVDAPGRAFWLMVADLVVVALALTELAIRQVVSRPQLATSEQEVRLDDVMRGVAARAIAGSGLALVMLGAGLVANTGGRLEAVRSQQPLEFVLFLLTLACTFGALVTWVSVSQTRLSVIQRSASHPRDAERSTASP